MNTEAIREMLKRQSLLAQNFYNKKALEWPEKVAQAVRLSSFLSAEVIEMLDELDWKELKKNKEFVKQNLVYEAVDVLKYLFQILDLFDAEPFEIAEAFCDKSYVVDRLIELRKNRIEKPTVIVDLDGVLANHTKGFLAFMDKQVGIKYDWKEFPSYSIFEMLKDKGCDLRTYRELQHEYRCSRYKLDLEPFEGVGEALMDLKNAGLDIAIMTSRPTEYKHMKFLTLKWLDQNNMKFDHIFWGRDKATMAIKSGKKIIAGFDNEPNNVFLFKQLGILSFKVEQDFPYQVDLFLRTCYRADEH